MLPFSLLYLWLNTIGGSFQSGLDGCIRTDIRGGLVIFENFLFIISALFLVPHYGLVGLYMRNCSKQLPVYYSAGCLFRVIFSRVAGRSLQVEPNIFQRDVPIWSSNFQVHRHICYVVEPVSKMLLGKFGNMSLAGYYEVAQRLITQTRTILLAANPVLIPVVAHFQETDEKKIKSIYRADYKLIYYISIPAFMGIVALSPVLAIY